MARGYQQGYSDSVSSMFDSESRRRKARTMVSVLSECSDRPLAALHALNVGGSAGIIDEYLSRHFASVTGIDIDGKTPVSGSSVSTEDAFGEVYMRQGGAPVTYTMRRV